MKFIKKQKNYETNKQITYVSFSKIILWKMFFDRNKEIIATHIINIGKIKVYNEIKIKVCKKWYFKLVKTRKLCLNSYFFYSFKNYQTSRAAATKYFLSENFFGILFQNLENVL